MNNYLTLLGEPLSPRPPEDLTPLQHLQRKFPGLIWKKGYWLTGTPVGDAIVVKVREDLTDYRLAGPFGTRKTHKLEGDDIPARLASLREHLNDDLAELRVMHENLGNAVEALL